MTDRMDEIGLLAGYMEQATNCGEWSIALVDRPGVDCMVYSTPGGKPDINVGMN